MWRWRKIRRADISQELRDELEQFGETVIAGALVLSPAGVTTQTSLYSLVSHHRDDALRWLTEKRDVAERREQRLETVEIAVLIFVILGVIVDVMLLLRH